MNPKASRLPNLLSPHAHRVSQQNGCYATSVNDKTRKQLLAQTEPLLTGDDWRAVQKLWQPYVDQADLDAMAYLGYLILWCFSAPNKVDSTMRRYLRTAAKAGHADAMYWMTKRSLVKGEKAAKLLLKAGELGSRGAQRDLGAFYATGDWGTGPKDSPRAVNWYKKAAERGHENAEYNLGFMYILGEGMTANVEQGLHWLTLSADHGNKDAMRLLGDLCRNGYYGVPQSIEQAEIWEKQFIDQKERLCFLHDLHGSL
jgi:TPR repeat protein